MNEELDYIPVPNFVMTHPELSSIDVMIYISIQKEQNRVGLLTQQSNYQNILNNVNRGAKIPKKGKKSKNDKISMKMMLKRIKKMEDLHILKNGITDIYLKLDNSDSPLFKRSSKNDMA